MTIVEASQKKSAYMNVSFASTRENAVTASMTQGKE